MRADDQDDEGTGYSRWPGVTEPKVMSTHLARSQKTSLRRRDLKEDQRVWKSQPLQNKNKGKKKKSFWQKELCKGPEATGSSEKSETASVGGANGQGEEGWDTRLQRWVEPILSGLASPAWATSILPSSLKPALQRMCSRLSSLLSVVQGRGQGIWWPEVPFPLCWAFCGLTS